MVTMNCASRTRPGTLISARDVLNEKVSVGVRVVLERLWNAFHNRSYEKSRIMESIWTTGLLTQASY